MSRISFYIRYQYFSGHLNIIRISKQKAVGGIWMKNFGKWVLIYVWLGLCPYFERVVPTSGSNRCAVRWYFEWRDPVLVTVQHGDPMRLQGVPHIHCVVTENIGNMVIGSKTLKNKLMIYGLKDRFKTQGVHSFELNSFQFPKFWKITFPFIRKSVIQFSHFVRRESHFYVDYFFRQKTTHYCH